MRALLRYSPVLLLFVPMSAYALTLEYLTYNAFDETAAAFKRLALITSDSGFMVLAACFVAVICIGSTLYYGAQSIGGRGQSPVTLFMPFLIGIMIFWGCILPKGSLQIYDPVRNRTELVPDIPALIVLLAGGLSVVEKGMTDMIDTASATPYKDDVGGISYSLIFSAIKASTMSTGLDRSMAQYFKDCGMTAIGSNYNGATMDEVIHGAPGWDLYSSFSKYNHPAWPTVWFPDGNDGGTTGTCADSWNYLSGKLNGSIATTMNPMKRAACESAGFNWADAAEQSSCDAMMVMGAQKFDSGVATSEVWLRSFAMGQALTVALNDPDFSTGINTLVNRQMMSESFGASAAMNQWIPRLRGIMIAVAVGVTPICLLFMATPLVLRALAVVAGLFIWLALWGICDVVAIQMQQDAAADAFAHIKQHNLGYLAIMNAPEGAVAALAVFGKARTMAMVLATVLTGGLFKLAGGYAFNSMGQGWQQDLNQGGESAGKQRLQVEQQANLQEQLNGAPGAMGRMQQFGYNTSVGASNFPQQQQLAQYDYLSGVSGGNTGELAYQAGEISGGRMMGDTSGVGEVANNLGTSMGGAASAMTASQTARSGGSAVGARERAGNGLVDVGRAEGLSGVTSTEARRDLAAEFGGKNEGDNLKSLATQENASTGGMIDESNRNPANARRYYGAQFERGFGELAAFQEMGVTPGRVGHAGGVETATDSVATERVLGGMGAGSMIDGKELHKAQGAAAGDTARELGGPQSVAAVTSRNQVAGDFGRATAQQQMSEFLFGDRTTDLAKFHEAGGSVFHGTLDGDAARRVIEHTENQGLITPQQADALRAKADSGFSAAVAFGDGGQIASFNLDGRYGGAVGNTMTDIAGNTFQRGDSYTVGNTHQVGDTFQVGDRTDVTQGMSLRGDAAVDTLQQFVSKTGDGPISETDQYAIASGYAQRLTSEGYRGTADASDSRIQTTNVGIGAGPGGKGGGLVGKALGAVGINVGASGTNQSSGGHSTSEDYVLTAFSGHINENYQEARASIEKRYGDSDNWDSQTKTKAEREIAQHWHQRNEIDFQQLKGTMLDGTVNHAAEGQGHSEVRDFAQSNDKLGRIGDKIEAAYDAAKDKFLPW